MSASPRTSGRTGTLVLSCYELGHQPVAAASALAFLERAGHRPVAVDLSVEPMDRLERILRERLRLVALSVPMHTALRLGVRAAARIRELAPHAHLCFFGLYATLNADFLLGRAADSVVGGEFEPTLVALADALEQGSPLEDVRGLWLRGRVAGPVLGRLSFPAPSRSALPPLDRYAKLVHRGETRQAAAVEASRGCLHLCRHCPIPAVYGGRFFVVQRDSVLADIRALAARGVGHITFADPDFFNGPGHSLAVLRRAHEEHPQLSFDVTTKIENLLVHRAKLDELARLGCIFVVSAVESLSDEVLSHLRKGHTRCDVTEALQIVRRAGMALRPTFVAFTPWTSLEGYLEILDWIEREGLQYSVDPVQLSIRLLVPPGSLLADLPAIQPHLRGFAPEGFCHRWEHPQPRMDRLQREVTALVQDAARRDEDAPTTFRRVRNAARAVAEQPELPVVTGAPPARGIARAPRLTEPWFC